MKFIHAVFLGKRPQIYNDVKEAPANQWIATGTLALLCIIFGLFAAAVPLDKFIYPVLNDSGMAIPSFLGSYDPLAIVILFLIVFLLGFGFYTLIRKVRYDEVYLGGMPALEKFRIAGTGFYNEVRNFTLIRSIYAAAEKKYFDLYELGKELTFGFSRTFQLAHPGQLQLYLLYIVIGILVLIALV
jgi:protein-S-isoprenylcysteine O-methyltransferase Ste14